MRTPATPLSEIQSTKRQFLVVVTGEYLITGYFWVFSTLGSVLLEGHTEAGHPNFFWADLFFHDVHPHAFQWNLGNSDGLVCR